MVLHKSIKWRLAALLVAVVFFLTYLSSRDTVRDYTSLSPEDVRAIVRGVNEWHAPKFFRDIEIRPERDGMICAWVREDGRKWSITVFAKDSGHWKKMRWLVVERG